jgi:hypothetical protein
MTHDTRTQLGDIPSLYALLGYFEIPGSGGDDNGRSAGSPARPPLSLDVLDLTDTRTKPDASPVRDDWERDKIMGARRQGILPTLGQWSRLVDGALWDADLKHDGPDEDPSVAGECRFLLQHLDWIQDQQWRNEFEADVSTMHRDLRRAIRDPEPPRLVCTVPGCDWAVVEMDRGSWFRCTGCGQITTRIEAHKTVEKLIPKPIRQCAREAQMSERAIRKLIEKGYLRTAGRDGKADLFTLNDIRAAMAEKRLADQLAPTGDAR